MRVLLISWLFVLCVACSNSEKSTTMLTSGQIALSQPRVELKDRILDGPQWIKSSLGLEGSHIYYTLDGSSPTRESALFKDSVLIESPGQVAIRAFHDDFKPSETVRIDFIEKGIDIKEVIWLSSLNKKYPGGGPNTLTNHRKGSSNFSSPQWLGFDSIAKVKIDLKKETMIDRLDLGYLVQTGSWIFPPKKVIVYSSDVNAAGVGNGKELIGEFSTDPLTEHVSTIRSLNIPVNKKVSSLELELHHEDNIPSWHDGSGNSGWLFMDEIIVYEKK